MAKKAESEAKGQDAARAEALRADPDHRPDLASGTGASGRAGPTRLIGRAAFFLLRGVFYVTALVTVLVAGLLVWIMDRPMEAPPWAQERIEAHIAAQSPNTVIRFGAMVLTVQSGWRPMLELRDVRFEDRAGTPLLAVSDLQATLAMRPLLDGLVQPRTVHMSGLFATMRRDVDGKVSVVTSADVGSPEVQAATLPELIKQVDRLFLVPELAALNTVDISSITLRFEDARARRVWTVDGARLNMQRDARNLTLTGDLALLSGGADVATMAANFTSPLGQAEAQFGVTVNGVAAQDIATFNPAFGWLDALRAPISGALRGGLTAEGKLTPVNATLQIAEGVLQPTGDTRPVPFTSARTYFEYDPAAASLRFDELSFASAWGRVAAEGQAMLSGLEEGRLDDLVGQFQFTGLELNPPGSFDAPRQLGRAEMDFRLVPHPFRLDLGRLRIEDQDNALVAKGVLSAAPGGWDLALDGRIDTLEPARLLDLWPAPAAPRLRDWISENFRAGALRNLDLALRTVPGSKPDAYLGFSIDGATIGYVDGMPPIENASGRASILRNRFALRLDKGQVEAPSGGQVDLAGSSFIIPDIRIKGGPPAQVRLRTKSRATAILSVLDSDPLNLLSKAGLATDIAEAEAEARAVLNLPLRKGLKPDELQFEVGGTLRNFRSDRLVPDRVLTAESLEVRASNRSETPGIEISGAGAFDGIPFDARWSQDFGADRSSVTAQLELSAQTLDTLKIALPPGAVGGRGTGNLALTLPKDGVPDFTLRSDLRGVTLSIPELGWSKAASRSGTLELDGQLGPVPRVDRLLLSAPGLEARGRVTLRESGGLAEARFERVRAGTWLDAPILLTGRGAGAAPAVTVSGGTLDLRGAEFGGGGGNSGGPLNLALDQLRITDTIALTGMRGDFTLRGGLQGTFTGQVNGSAPVRGRVVPEAGRSAFQIESDNAGAVFAAANFLKQARGGKMTLLLTPVGTAGAFNGALNITETRVRDAPAIAALLNALSVVGLLEQMGGQGLHFEQVDAAFRLTPDRVTLTEASAVGPSIGLSMDGTYDVNTARMDMQGVFSPIYLINGIGSVLTRRGEGLIGFNFRLTGPASDPRVQVNPLSALTPSIFREIFRRPPPEVAVEPGEVEGSAEPRVLRQEPDAPSPGEDELGGGNR